MTITDALAELGNQIGIPDLELDEEGVVAVQFDNTLTVNFHSLLDGRHLHLSGVATGGGEVPLDEALLERLLHANLLGLGTGGAHFSYASETSEIHLGRTLDMDVLDLTTFTNRIEQFVNHLEGWRTELDSRPVSPASDVTGGASFCASDEL